AAGNIGWNNSTSYTATTLDNAAPIVTGNTPTGTDVPVTTNITVSFNESMNTTSVQSAFDIDPNVPGILSWSGDMMNFTLTPYADLTSDILYNVTIGTGAQDLAGNNLATAYLWNFTTESNNIISDDFSASTLNTTLWTVFNPKSDANFTIVGTGTSDALLSISVPNGTSHNVWDSGNLAPRIMQAANNTDFEIEVKFESQLTSEFQMQGVIVQQNDSNYLRFDFFKDATKTYVFAASITNGTPNQENILEISPGNPLYLRVKRQGDQWTQSYSYDGANWITAANFSHVLSVTSVGPFVGNHGNPESSSPAFTGLIDYFFNTTSPIIPEDPDSTPPTVIGNTPTGTGVPVTTNITVTFNESMNTTSVQSVFDINPNVPGILSWSGDMMNFTLTPYADLTSDILYNVTIGTGAQDLAGNNLATAYLWNFTTESNNIISDDFSASTLNTTLWTVFNPKSDANFTIVGTGTSDALLSISVPNGTSHNVWDSGNLAPRIMQAANNTDFEIEVKFESQLTSEFQMQGVIVQQNDSNYLRFDFFKDATKTYVFAASITNGTPNQENILEISPGNPLYLRVKRQGDQWTQSYSYDGANWITAANFSHVLSVTSVGPFVGNHGNPESSSPAFTGLIDYFFNTTSPIIPEDPDSTPPTVIVNTPTGTGIPVTTNITVTFNESMNKTSVENAFSIDPSVNGTFTWSTMNFNPDANLTPNTLYNVTIRTGAQDLAGNNLATAYIWNFTTAAAPVPPNTTPPVPTNLQNMTGNDWVKFTWTAGVGIVTDGYNVSMNHGWYNKTNTFLNSTVGAGNWSNITVWAWNATGAGNMSATNVSDNVQA
ncbi:MAG: Ig-like domain-containing protein, partial [Methanosarcinales archaeon]|nr:Ig-like domain-containing protein [Methanosarcinales archaeon]